MPRFAWIADPALHELRTQIWGNKTIAFGIGAVLQGIMGWSAFMIAYNKPTIGIGCCAFVYISCHHSVVFLSCLGHNSRTMSAIIENSLPWDILKKQK